MYHKELGHEAIEAAELFLCRISDVVAGQIDSTG